MKKIVIGIIAVVLMFTATACGSKPADIPAERSSEAAEMSSAARDTEIDQDNEEPDANEPAANEEDEGDNTFHNATFKYDGQVFAFNKEHSFYGCKFMTSNLMEYHKNSGFFYKDMKYNDSFAIYFYVQDGQAYDKDLEKEIPTSGFETVEINGIPWMRYKTSDGSSTSVKFIYSYMSDPELNENPFRAYMFEIISYVPESELDVDELADVYMQTVRL